MNETELYEYFETRHNEDVENKCCSFTYWNFLYDMLKQDRIDPDSLLYYQLEDRTRELINYNENINITNNLIAEIIDISELQEYAEDFIFWHN